MYDYSFKEFRNDVDALYLKSKDYKFDAILAIARGGWTLAHFLANKFDTRELYSMNAIHYEGVGAKNGEPGKRTVTYEVYNIPNLNHCKKVLIVEDIIDSGDTMMHVLEALREKFPQTEFKIASIFYKPTACVLPDYGLKEADDWVDFFWEVV